MFIDLKDAYTTDDVFWLLVLFAVNILIYLNKQAEYYYIGFTLTNERVK